MPHRTRGFTLLDLVIVLAFAGLAAIVVVPQRRVRWMMANEERIVADLREVEQRLVADQKLARRDTDHDGVGEYAPLTEVLGPLAASAVRQGTSDIWEIDGYWFAVMVPGPRKLPILAGAPGESADCSEAGYLVIAWPRRPGETGMRAYLASPHGILVHQIDGYPYGLEPPAPEWPLIKYDGDTVLGGDAYTGGDWRTPVRTLSK